MDRGGRIPWSAWAVHALTASGVLLALLALLAIARGDWPAALGWLAAALVIDGVDGWLARKAQVKTRLPRIDGAALDLVVDYLNYAFVPAIFILAAGLVPAPLAPWLAGLVLLSSLYVFARADMKTEDNYFRGFPALWNLVAFYLYVARPGEAAGAALVLFLAAATFAPVHFIHPMRVLDHGRWPPALALGWAAASGALIWPGWGPDARALLLAASAATGGALILLGLWRTLKGPRKRR